MPITAAALSDKGRVRDSNEDRCALPPETAGESPKGRLFIVADGMGGYAAGEVAAQIATTEVMRAYYAAETSDVVEALTGAVAAAQFAIQQAQQQSPDQAQMGSTLVAAVVTGDTLTVTNVGDSRCFLLRDGALSQVSTDHSWVAEQVRAGVITPEAARHHPMRNALTRALGQPQVAATPDFNTLPWQPGDRLLLCSDGLWDTLTNDQLQGMLQMEPAQAVQALIEKANELGATDNVTAVVVQDSAAVTAASLSAATVPEIATPTSTTAKLAPLEATQATRAVAVSPAQKSNGSGFNPMLLAPIGALIALLACAGLALTGALGRLFGAAGPSATPTTLVAQATAIRATSATVTPLPATAISAAATALPTLALPSATARPAATASAPNATPAQGAVIVIATATLNPQPTPQAVASATPVPAAPAQDATGDLRLCMASKFAAPACGENQAAALSGAESRMFASWPAAVTAGQRFTVDWSRFNPVLKRSELIRRVTCLPLGDKHSCTEVGKRGQPVQVAQDEAGSNYSAVFNGDTNGDGISPIWNVRGFPGGEYSIEVKVGTRSAYNQKFSIVK